MSILAHWSFFLPSLAESTWDLFSAIWRAERFWYPLLLTIWTSTFARSSPRAIVCMRSPSHFLFLLLPISQWVFPVFADRVSAPPSGAPSIVNFVVVGRGPDRRHFASNMGAGNSPSTLVQAFGLLGAFPAVRSGCFSLMYTQGDCPRRSR